MTATSANRQITLGSVCETTNHSQAVDTSDHAPTERYPLATCATTVIRSLGARRVALSVRRTSAAAKMAKPKSVQVTIGPLQRSVGFALC